MTTSRIAELEAALAEVLPFVEDASTGKSAVAAWHRKHASAIAMAAKSHGREHLLSPTTAASPPPAALGVGEVAAIVYPLLSAASNSAKITLAQADAKVARGRGSPERAGALESPCNGAQAGCLGIQGGAR